MYLAEQYTLYKVAYELAMKNGFEIIHINEDKEIWLEKYAHKTSKVIRLQHGGFDWKNHLKQDIAAVFQKAKAMKRLLRGKTIDIYNIYVSSHEPIDDWEFLKKPMQLKEKQPIKMHVYYVSNMDDSNELNRFRLESGIDEWNDVQVDDADTTEQLSLYKNTLHEAFIQKQKDVQNVFAQGKPIWTYILLGINIIMFILLSIFGGSTDIATLIEFGAKYNPAIIEDDEWWRLISSMFLHIGLLHLLMNMLAIYFLGTAVERIYGSWRFVVIYFLAGIGGSLASFAFTNSISAGASGALFGLFGALLFFGTVYKKIFFQTMGQNVLLVIVINLVLGFGIAEIDMGAHLGGLVAGFLASALLSIPNKQRRSVQVGAGVTYILLVVGLMLYGLQSNLDDPSYHLLKLDELSQNEQYEDMIDRATVALHNPEDKEAIILFQRSYANMNLGRPEDAIPDLEQVVQINDEFAEAFYNLASAYAQTGLNEKAVKAVERAYELKPSDEGFQDLYEAITGDRPKQ
ncbi:rhomboid family intramembrane serine protease [Lentibacillus saliphilus]|uniref:rhomboid family intramembrane serine protease n=1 Tax=Lentibacillus saliphilus TaxID=2737028 RepID=UPI001C2F2B99|nr:rhomboid family intramembrane serine protease [Lentibacillus saliphilus]